MSKVQLLSSDWERGVSEIEEKLLTLSGPDLNYICPALDLAVDQNEMGSARIMRRHILQFVEGDAVTSREDEGMSVLLHLNNTIDEVKKKITKK